MINCSCFHPSCGVRVVAASSENFWWWSAAGAVVVDDGVPVARSIVTSHSMEEEMAPPPPRSVGRVLLRTKRKKQPPTQKVFTNLEKLDKCGRLRTPRAARELALWVLVPFTHPPLAGLFCFFPKLSEIWLQVRRRRRYICICLCRECESFSIFDSSQSFFFMASSEFWKARARNWLSYGRSVLYAAFVSGVHPLRVFDDRTKQRACMCLSLSSSTNWPWSLNSKKPNKFFHDAFSLGFLLSFFFSLCFSLL